MTMTEASKQAPVRRVEQLLGAPARETGTASADSKVKRAIDVVGALAGILFLAPLLVLVSIAIMLDSRGPVLFRQQRTGLNGRPFTIYKFRSMTVMENGGTVVQATKNDTRITRVGAILRRSSIDELPQLLNVLKGDMSLVGPRPHAKAHDDYYSALVSDYNKRFDAKPGLTGLAQVSGYRGETARLEQMSMRIAYDLTYITYWSAWMDIKIILQTVAKLPFDSAAY
jgi:putative colanic acid biosynthesis UDP-glucose lipid carrier transferase